MADLTVAAAQAISSRGEVSANIERHCRLVELAATRNADVIVFPELSLTGYEPDLAEPLAFWPADARLGSLQEAADSSAIVIVAGAPIRLDSGLHIGAFGLAPDREPCVYTKHHVTAAEARFFVNGDRNPLVEVASECAAIAICADTKTASHPAAAAGRGAGIYLAGVFFNPEGIAENLDSLAGSASAHTMIVAMANAGSDTAVYRSAGRSSIWSENGDCIVQLAGAGEGLAIASRTAGTWTGETLCP